MNEHAMRMKKHPMQSRGAGISLFKWLVLLVVAAICFGSCAAFFGYNSLVGRQEEVARQWANVQVQYQRRADLIPNLVEVVRAYADHEESVQVAVTTARVQAAELRAAAAGLAPGQVQAYAAAEAGLTAALTRLLVTVEAYPELKANENFLALQSQLEGTENRIATERSRYNEVVRAHNVAVSRLPGRIWAALFGFEQFPYFNAEAGAEQAPDVNFR